VHFDAFDIVVVPFPYADRLAEKRRPALVISNRKLTPFGLIWVAMITSAANAPWSCDVTIVELARAGLTRAIRSAYRKDRLHRTRGDRAPSRTARQGDCKSRRLRKLKGFLGSA